MKKLLFFLLSILILGGITGCNHTDAPQVTQETAGANGFQSVDLEKYSIVYGENNPEYAELANQLADHVLDKYDIFLTTACDTDTSPAQYEILLGDTNRSDRKGRIMEYSVTVDDGKLHLLAGGAFSAEQGIRYLCENLFNVESFCVENGE